MPAHPRPWHRNSVFGNGPRRPLDREQRARFRFLLNAHRRARRLTPHAELIGNALLRRLSTDGRCDPCHDRLAADAGCSSRTVRRALEALRALGLVIWQRRIIRSGPSVDQTSNAYLLTAVAGPVAATPVCKKEGNEVSGFAGHVVHRLDSRDLPRLNLAQIAAQRMAAGALVLGRVRVGRARS